MTKRGQRRAALVLGVAALAMMTGTVLHYAAAGARRALILEAAGPSSLPEAAVVRIDLNTAEAWELEALPGIGKVLAERIVARRETCGPFETREDILAVEGIGETVFTEIQPYITY